MDKFKKMANAIVHLFAIIGFVLVSGYGAIRLGWTKTSGIIDTQRETFLKDIKDIHASQPSWADSEEWQIFSQAIIKDKEDLEKASLLSGVPARLIVAQLVAEQLRLFYTQRELFKTVFAPLKLLGNQSQFSWGVAGLKQETAQTIETNLKDTASPFYLGKSYESLLDFKTSDIDQERFARIVNDDSRFYSYLYVGLYLKQIINQWQKAGFDISDRPEILSTLYNIGFEHSEPKADPKVGGSTLTIDGEVKSFGGLAGEFYSSDELVGVFPR
jgi:hypothetical protein